MRGLNFYQYQLTALKHTYHLRGMTSTLCMRTTISPEQWQPWTADLPLSGLISLACLWVISGGQPAYQRPFTAQASASTALIVSSTVSNWQLLVGNCKTVLPRHVYGHGIRKIDLCAQINLKQYQLTTLKHTYQLRGMASTLRMRKTMSPNKGETAVHGRHCRGDMVVRMYRAELVRVLRCG